MDGVTRDSVTLRWDAPRDTGGVPLSGYIVEQQDGGKTAPGSAARWKVAAYVDPARTWWTVGGLVQGYEYWFRVRAENPDGAGSACALSSAVVPKPVVCKLSYNDCQISSRLLQCYYYHASQHRRHFLPGGGNLLP